MGVIMPSEKFKMTPRIKWLFGFQPEKSPFDNF